MPVEDPFELKRVDRDIKIQQLKEEAADRGEFQDDEYWRLLYNLEYAPWTTEYELLQEAGVDLPPPDALDEDELTAKLWEVIENLASRRSFLSCTDHLSDRELYSELITDVLHQPRRDVIREDDSSHEIDVLGGCSGDDLKLYFLYYISAEDRRFWGAQAAMMPQRIEPPYDRDRFLPCARV